MYHIGQTVPHKPRQIIADGEARWHCLFTRQQSESAAVARLKVLGIHSFFPVTETERIVRGQKTIIESRFLPGYVFAHFDGRPLWYELWQACSFVRDVLRLRNGDEPGWIMPEDLTALMAMRATDQEQARARKARSLIRRGDRVKLRTGPFQGYEAEVHTLVTVRGKARGKFTIPLFGGTVPGEASLDDMERVA